MDIAGDNEQSLNDRSRKCETFSLPLAENTDITDTAQLAIFVSGVDKTTTSLNIDTSQLVIFHCIIHQHSLCSKSLKTRRKRHKMSQPLWF